MRWKLLSLPRAIGTCTKARTRAGWDDCVRSETWVSAALRATVVVQISGQWRPMATESLDSRRPWRAAALSSGGRVLFKSRTANCAVGDMYSEDEDFRCEILYLYGVWSAEFQDLILIPCLGRKAVRESLTTGVGAILLQTSAWGRNPRSQGNQIGFQPQGLGRSSENASSPHILRLTQSPGSITMAPT